MAPSFVQVNIHSFANNCSDTDLVSLPVCVEAGMIALREGATKLGHEHFLSGIAEG